MTYTPKTWVNGDIIHDYDMNHIEKGISNLKISDPDSYTGSDSEKIQACFDAMASTGGILSINRTYTLTEDIIVKTDSNADKPLYIIGTGENAKINFGTYCIKGDFSVSLPTGNIRFSNLHLIGTGTCFDCNTLIRIAVNNCYFDSFDKVFYNTMTDSARMQTIYVSNSTFRRCDTVFHNYGALYDVRVEHSIFEWCHKAYDTDNSDYIWSLVFRDCMLEGFYDTCFTITKARSVIIEGNYFELNNGYIVITDNDSTGVVISNNYISNDPNATFFVTLNKTATGLNKLNGIIESNYIKYSGFPVVGWAEEPTGTMDWRVAYNTSAAITYADKLNPLFNDLNSNLIYLIGRRNDVSADFNNYTTQGVFLYGGGATIQNAPVNEYGLLEVFKSLYIVQRFTDHNGNIYVRISTNGTTWSAWKTHTA